MFNGLSTLRAKEKEKPVELSEEAKARQAYLLAKYTGGSTPGGTAGEKKKRKKKKPKAELAGVRIVDEDVSGFGAVKVQQQADEDEEEDDVTPVIANPVEAERLRRQLQQVKEEGYLKVREDGSGWQAAAGTARGGNGTTSASLQGGDGSDASPPRRQRHDSGSDASPPRRQRHDSGSDASPPRRQRHDSEDLSPPRKQARHDSPDASPPRRRQRHDSEDLSPPRKVARSASLDASPPRRQQQADDDLSPPRKGRASSPDLSPPRQAAAGAGRAAVMADGTRSGKVTGRELAEELARKRAADAARFQAMDASVSGRHAATVHRDKTGKAVSLAELEAQRKADKKPEPEKPEWGGGLKQQRDAAARAARTAAEAAKPFARSRDDPELDALHRERERWGDPMAGLVKKKPLAEPAPMMDRKRQKKSGFIIPQEVPPHSWLKRGLGPPGNRYNIRPGRHWDGVDRSNGFEKGMFKTQNELAYRAQEAHMWAQADM